MKRQRLAGIEKEILRVISKVLFEEVKNPKISGKVSVTKVSVTEDLKFADTYFSILPQISSNLDEEKKSEIKEEEILEGLNQIKGFLRKKVAEEVSIRYIPEIRIKLDKSIENAIKITELLNKLKV
ncbi:MAG: 30S ribosome-binding factor RbfA [Fusobacterium sp.]|nr:30S ribosome-binding factor RbfA [Fusobacterium sp.]